jgi:hypothetical protein
VLVTSLHDTVAPAVVRWDTLPPPVVSFAEHDIHVPAEPLTSPVTLWQLADGVSDVIVTPAMCARTGPDAALPAAKTSCPVCEIATAFHDDGNVGTETDTDDQVLDVMLPE